MNRTTLIEEVRFLQRELTSCTTDWYALFRELRDMTDSRDEYQVAADKLAWECKVLRDAAQAGLDALIAMQSYAVAENKGLRICDESITQLQAALEVDPCPQPEQEPDVANRMNALQDPLPPTETKTRAANSVQPEKVKPWVGLTEQERNDTEDYCEMIIGKPAFDVIEAKLKEKNNG